MLIGISGLWVSFGKSKGRLGVKTTNSKGTQHQGNKHVHNKETLSKKYHKKITSEKKFKEQYNKKIKNTKWLLLVHVQTSCHLLYNNQQLLHLSTWPLITWPLSHDSPWPIRDRKQKRSPFFSVCFFEICCYKHYNLNLATGQDRRQTSIPA